MKARARRTPHSMHRHSEEEGNGGSFRRCSPARVCGLRHAMGRPVCAFVITLLVGAGCASLCEREVRQRCERHFECATDEWKASEAFALTYGVSVEDCEAKPFECSA